MIRKGITLAITALFVGIAITPICAAQSANQSTNTTENINNKFLGHYFGLEGNIRIIYNATACFEPIIPLTGEYCREISVSYKITGILAVFISRLLSGRMGMEITLSVEDVPDYATVRVSPKVVNTVIEPHWNSEPCYYYIALSEDAPAYETCYFKLKATSISIKGPFGLFTWIHDAEHVEDIPFVPAYLPIIDITPETSYIETPPGEITNLSIFFENLGNGLTMVNAKIIQIPSDDWWCYIQPETVLGVGESKNVPFFILPPGNFSGHEDIRLSFTPSYFYDPTQQGYTYNFTITVHYRP
ncbi:MAG: hypothetical protein KAJ44_03265 [Thermoplasmatales archaeon]|nr:hypothetical protein [Thermoplasmatales archaeon]